MCPPFNRLFAWHRRRGLLWLLAVLTVVFFAAAGWFAREMDQHGANIFELEFVATSEKAQQYKAEFSDEWESDAQASLGLDYGFLISYGLLLVGLSIAVADRSLRAGHRRLAALGPWVAWGALGAAMFDAAENAFLIAIVNGATGDPWPALATGCAVAKFYLAGIAVVYVVGGWLGTLGVRPNPSLAQSS